MSYGAINTGGQTLSYSMRHWQTDDGLPQNPIHAIAQTPEGYLWVGTHAGLARFDGVRFARFDEGAVAELTNAWITALCLGRDGALWIGGEGIGAVRFKEGKFLRISESGGLTSNQVRAIYETEDGTLWIGTEAGLTLYKDGKLASYSDKHGLGDNSVRALAGDPDGILRIATRRGLSSFRPDGVITNLNVGAGAVANACRSVLRDRRGALWVGSNDGLTCYRGNEKLVWRDELPDRIVTAILEDRAGQIWVGTYAGLVRLVNEKLVSAAPEAGISDLVQTLFEDQEGNLWVGARDGLYRVTPNRFTTYTTEQGLGRNNVMSVLEDRSGTVWVGTWGGGLTAIREGRLTTYCTTNGLTHDEVLALHQTRDGSLWVGMDFGGGLNRLDADGRSNHPRLTNLLSEAIRFIHEDRGGALWIGTSRGLNLVRGDTVQTCGLSQGLPGELVMAICERADGSIWLGTDRGLCRSDGAGFTKWTLRDGLSNEAVQALYEDHLGDLWIGTRAAGLNRLRGGRFTAYGTEQGLFSDEVYEILEDESGHFWLSCREGIFRVPRSHFDDLDRGTRSKVVCTVFGKADGLLSVQCNGVAKPAAWKSRDGRLWFPTVRGVVAVQPRLDTNERPPPVLIEEVRSGGRMLRARFAPPGESLVIPPGRGEVEIHFTALSLSRPEKNRFRYKLQDTDSDWIDGGLDRVARYYNLPPGNHEFQVIACNNDGVWNNAGARMTLEVQPHFWQTLWFKISMVGAVVAGLAVLFRSRVARLREIEALRIQIAANLHDDVGARLTKVAMVTEFLDQETRGNDATKSHIQTIARTTREIIQAMDVIVWTINPRNDSLEHLANYIFQYAQEYFQNTGVRCRLSLPAQIPDLPFSTESRHNVFMAVKEALNNVLKHAHANEVRISVGLKQDWLSILITDNGRGFEPAQARDKGNGLQNMRERLETIGGRLSLASEPGAGTTITMEARAA